MTRKNENGEDGDGENEMTMETALPIPVEPPLQARLDLGMAVETETDTETEVDADVEAQLQAATERHAPAEAHVEADIVGDIVTATAVAIPEADPITIHASEAYAIHDDGSNDVDGQHCQSHEPSHQSSLSAVGAAAATAVKMVTVIAPQSLPGRYTFPAQVDDIDFVVTVPDRGVVEGEQFQVPYPSASTRQCHATNRYDEDEPRDVGIAAVDETGEKDMQGSAATAQGRQDNVGGIMNRTMMMGANGNRNGDGGRYGDRRGNGCGGGCDCDYGNNPLNPNHQHCSHTGNSSSDGDANESDQLPCQRHNMSRIGAAAPSAPTNMQPLEMAGNLSSDTDDAPTERWRYRLCECKSILFRPACLFGIICTPIVYGQIAQRLKLNCLGLPSTRSNEYRYTCALSTVTHIVLQSLSFLVLPIYVSYIWYVYIWIFFTHTRYYYRQKYKIPPSTCACCDGRLDDFMYAGFCCSGCVSIQILRHTHDEKQHRYKFWRQTGLGRDAPEIV